MARVIPFSWVVLPSEMIALTLLDKVDNPDNTAAMTCHSPKSTGAACKLPQCMVDHTPKYENSMRKKGRRPNQVVGKGGIIRADRRKKAKYL